MVGLCLPVHAANKALSFHKFCYEFCIRFAGYRSRPNYIFVAIPTIELQECNFLGIPGIPFQPSKRLIYLHFTGKDVRPHILALVLHFTKFEQEELFGILMLQINERNSNR